MRVLNVNQPADAKWLRTPTVEFDFSASTPAAITDLIDSMRTTMHEHNGIGLAANQVGLPHRLFIAEPPVTNPRQRQFYAVFNPKLISASDTKVTNPEGCLSIPGTEGAVERHTRITISGQDQHGRPLRLKVSGIVARIFQHEMDHLDGVLFTDKATNITTTTAESSDKK